MKEKLFKISINSKIYISIGSYMDNNDGIMYYAPQSDDLSEWYHTLIAEDTIISLWLLGYLYFDFNENVRESNKIEEDELLPELYKKLISNHDLYTSFKQFFEKYLDDQSGVNNKFADFIFDKKYYQPCSGKTYVYINETYNNERLIENHYEYEGKKYVIKLVETPNNETLDDNSDHVFVKEEYYETLKNDINKIIDLLF